MDVSVTEKEIYISELPSLPSTQKKVPPGHGTKSWILYLHSLGVQAMMIVRLSGHPLVQDSLNTRYTWDDWYVHFASCFYVNIYCIMGCYYTLYLITYGYSLLFYKVYHEEGECRQLEFRNGKGANFRDLFYTTPKVLKLHGACFWNI